MDALRDTANIATSYANRERGRLDTLGYLAILRTDVDHDIALQISECRDAKIPWADIAAELGITERAARYRVDVALGW